jgi:hypothetical protein
MLLDTLLVMLSDSFHRRENMIAGLSNDLLSGPHEDVRV